jgi:hypothetical protein
MTKFILAFLCGVASAPVVSQDSIVLIDGYEINSKIASTMLVEVEEAYNTSVVFILGDYSEEMAGGANISTNGQPYVFLDTINGILESTLVHELEHLRRFSAGWPYIDITIDSPRFRDSLGREKAEPFLDQLNSMFTSGIGHYFMYPSLRGKGINPDDLEIESVSKQIHASDSFYIVSDTMEIGGRVYLHAVCHVDGSLELDSLRTRFVEKGWDEPVKVVEEIEVYLKSQPDSPQGYVNSIIFALNRFYKYLGINFGQCITSNGGRGDCAARIDSRSRPRG